MKTIDPAELTRFILSGIVSALANIGTVRLARFVLSYDLALVVGIVVALAVSFALTKLFAFGSKSWSRAPGQAVRFLIVFLSGCVLYWAVAVTVNRLGIGYGLSGVVAETAGIIVGGGVMMVSSYFGHRFFTYRTYQRAVGAG
jgi:putative flippase GtrA